MYVSDTEIDYCNSFGVKHVPKEIKTFIGNNDIKTNIFRIQSNNSIMRGYFCIGFIDFMVKSKTLTEYTNLFSPCDFKKNKSITLESFQKVNLTNQTKFRLNEIGRIENYFNQEINQKESWRQKLNKYVAPLDYINKGLLVSTATSGAVFIISFTSIIGAPVGIASVSFSLVFPLITGIIKKLLSITRNKNKHDKTLVLTKSKLNSIDTSVSQALIDMETSHEEFITILNEKDKYEKIENVTSVSKKMKTRD